MTFSFPDKNKLSECMDIMGEMYKVKFDPKDYCARPTLSESLQIEPSVKMLPPADIIDNYDTAAKIDTFAVDNFTTGGTTEIYPVGDKYDNSTDS